MPPPLPDTGQHVSCQAAGKAPPPLSIVILQDRVEKNRSKVIFKQGNSVLESKSFIYG